MGGPIKPILVGLLVLSGLPASADEVIVSFRDSGSDIFAVATTLCPLVDATVRIDLRPSAAGVLIDTVRGGPGSRDPLTPRLLTGEAVLAPVADGARELTLTITLLEPEGAVVVSLDTDDSIGVSEGNRIQVIGAEIAGATVEVSMAGTTTTGVFDTQGDAYVPHPACTQFNS